MSTYSKQTKHPVTGEWHEATWIDDYYGRHLYGVQFPDAKIFDPDKTKLETRDSGKIITVYVDSRTPEEREADSKIETTVTTASAMNYTDKRLEEKRTINPDTCCSECKRYGTTPSKFPIWCSDNNCYCHTSIAQALAEEREKVVGLIEEIRGMREESNEALDYLQDRIEKDLLASLDKPDKNKCPKCDGWLKKWFDRQIFTGMHCGNCGYFSSLDKENNKFMGMDASSQGLDFDEQLAENERMRDVGILLNKKLTDKE